jgi:hypothetical protein
MWNCRVGLALRIILTATMAWAQAPPTTPPRMWVCLSRSVAESSPMAARPRATLARRRHHLRDRLHQQGFHRPLSHRRGAPGSGAHRPRGEVSAPRQSRHDSDAFKFRHPFALRGQHPRRCCQCTRVPQRHPHLAPWSSRARNPSFFASASSRCLDGGDVDLLHRHHCLEGTLCLSATCRKRVG